MKKKERVVLLLRVDKDIKKTIKAIADRDEVSLNVVANRLLREVLKK